MLICFNLPFFYIVIKKNLSVVAPRAEVVVAPNPKWEY
jgi:hypothetical protein